MLNVLIAAVISFWICSVYLFITKYLKHRISERKRGDLAKSKL